MVSPVFTAAMESFGNLTSFFAPLVFGRQRHGCKFPVAFGHNSTPPLGLHDHFFSRWTSESCEWKNLCHSSAFRKGKPQSQRVTRGDSEWTTCVTAPLLPKLCVAAENRTQVPFTQHGCITCCAPRTHHHHPQVSQHSGHCALEQCGQ